MSDLLLVICIVIFNNCLVFLICFFVLLVVLSWFKNCCIFDVFLEWSVESKWKLYSVDGGVDEDRFGLEDVFVDSFVFELDIELYIDI